MMIADVGGIENVSGSRIATPFAPPSPGSTPISTPSRMPTNMNSTFFHVSATAKPCIRLLISSTRSPLLVLRWRGAGSGTSTTNRWFTALEPEQTLDRTLGQRDEEPELEQREDRGRHADGYAQRGRPPILALPDA